MRCEPERLALSADFPPTSFRSSPWSRLYSSLLRRGRRRDAVANDIDAVAALAVALVFGIAFDKAGVGDAAQRQRQRAGLPHACQRLGLVGLQFERHGLAEHGVLAVFLLRRLINRENADIAQ